MQVVMPATVSAKLLTAPANWLICTAREVPTTWEEVPKATPWATGLPRRNSLQQAGPMTLPTIPVTMMAAVVMAAMPPISALRGAPMAVGVNEGRQQGAPLGVQHLLALFR